MGEFYYEACKIAAAVHILVGPISQEKFDAIAAHAERTIEEAVLAEREKHEPAAVTS